MQLSMGRGRGGSQRRRTPKLGHVPLQVVPRGWGWGGDASFQLYSAGLGLQSGGDAAREAVGWMDSGVSGPWTAARPHAHPRFIVTRRGEVRETGGCRRAPQPGP